MGSYYVDVMHMQSRTCISVLVASICPSICTFLCLSICLQVCLLVLKSDMLFFNQGVFTFNLHANPSKKSHKRTLGSFRTPGPCLIPM